MHRDVPVDLNAHVAAVLLAARRARDEAIARVQADERELVARARAGRT